VPASTVISPASPEMPATATSTVLRVRGVRKVFPAARGSAARVALDGVSLDAPSRTITALLGPNGSGKSTLMRLVATIERADAGEIEVAGADARVAPGRARAALGMVFQRPGLDALLSVRENLLLQAALVGLRGGAAKERVDACIDAVRLGERAGDRVGTLSGGMQRRADLARALVARPALLLLDEPTGGLDLESRREFMDLVRQRASTPGGGLAVLMSTHLMDEAEHADRVVMLSRGRVVAQGTPAELRASAGERVLRTASAHAPDLQSAGLVVRVMGGEALATGDEDALEHASRMLVRRGIAFACGPATLGDAYLAITGSALVEGGRS
jgi:ABC-2 type transport system ATP-binding protein